MSAGCPSEHSEQKSLRNVPSVLTPFRAVLYAELREAFGRQIVATFVAASLLGLLLALWLPHWPETIYQFFLRVFYLRNWSEIVLANDYCGLFVLIYWVGIFKLLRVYMVPKEERYLELLLSKPLSRRDYLLARLIPIIFSTIAAGSGAGAIHGLCAAALGLDVEPRSFSVTVGVIVALSVCLIGLVNLLILFTNDSYTALLVAFLPMMITFFPGITFMYRPDVFEAAPALRDILVFPLNLIWYPGFARQWGAAIAVGFLLVATGLVLVAGSLLERKDVA
jgi:hypothetical protein